MFESCIIYESFTSNTTKSPKIGLKKFYFVKEFSSLKCELQMYILYLYNPTYSGKSILCKKPNPNGKKGRGYVKVK